MALMKKKQPEIEFVLNSQSLKFSDEEDNVHYMNQGESYPLTLRIHNEALLNSGFYLLLELDFVDRGLTESCSTLMERWSNLHPGHCLFKLDNEWDEEAEEEEKETFSVILQELNTLQLSLRRPLETLTRLTITINCVLSQFQYQIQQLLLHADQTDPPNKPHFWLNIRLFSEARSLLHGKRFPLKTFWPGQAADRCSLDSHTLLSGRSAAEIYKRRLNPRRFYRDDSRQFVYMLNAPPPPEANQAKVNITVGKEYELTIRPCAFQARRCPLHFIVQLNYFTRTDGQNWVSLSREATNWAMTHQDRPLLELLPQAGALEESVFEIMQDGCTQFALLWAPEEEVRLAFRFNCSQMELDGGQLPSCTLLKVEAWRPSETGSAKIDESSFELQIKSANSNANWMDQKKDSTTFLNNGYRFSATNLRALKGEGSSSSSSSAVNRIQQPQQQATPISSIPSNFSFDTPVFDASSPAANSS